MNTQNDLTLELSRLAALAGRLASEGQMNLNKLVEAAIYAQVRRAAWRFRPQVKAANMQAELESGLQFLKQHSITPEIVTALEVGKQALAEHRHGDLLFHEAPDVFVCRVCGHAAIQSAPERCPDCGAWSGGFRKFVAIYQDNIEPTNPMAILTMLTQNAEDLSKLVGGISEEAATWRPAGTDWSVRDHVAHFADTQTMFDTRVELMLRHENPELTALPLSGSTAATEGHPLTTREMLLAFLEKRAQSVARLEALPLKDLWRTGRHPEFGQISVLRQAAYIAFHDQTHLPEVESLRAQAG